MARQILGLVRRRQVDQREGAQDDVLNRGALGDPLSQRHRRHLKGLLITTLVLKYREWHVVDSEV